MNKRHDASMTVCVNHGLKIDFSFGTTRAWAFMVKHQVPPAVILRVLVSSIRRMEDPQAITIGYIDVNVTLSDHLLNLKRSYLV